MALAFDKIIVITRRTAAEELTERFGTRAQARFYLEQEAARSAAGAGPDFAAVERADQVYARARDLLRAALPQNAGAGGKQAAARVQWVDRAFLPTFTFGERDLVVTLGPDGLVVNAAKYVPDGLPLLAFNPDPERIEGVLVPFAVGEASAWLGRVLRGEYNCRKITMARADLSDGQTLHAVNDLFVGRATHVSARYRLQAGDKAEDQSSSGIIVSTGAGSTGWLRSVVAGAAGVVAARGGEPGPAALPDAARFAWDAPFLRFSVREPWASKTTGASLVHGEIARGQVLEIVSQMPQNGVVFSDGVEEDFLPFNSGAVARIRVADKSVSLIAA